MLDLVQCHAWIQASDEAVWITLRGGQYARIVECQVLPILFAQFLRLNECTFSRLPSAVDENGRRVGQRLLDLVGDVTANYVSVINHQLDDNQPCGGRLCIADRT
jgi:hypothetical protein